MDKRFQLQIGAGGVDLGDLRKREFAGEDDAARAERGKHLAGSGVGDVRLCGDMHGQPGRSLFADGEHPQIGDEDSVCAHFRKRRKVGGKFPKVCVARKDIDGDVHLFAQRMGKSDALGKFVLRKIVGKSTQRKSFPARVHGVRAEVQRALEFRKAARRRQQFRLHASPPVAQSGRSPARSPPRSCRPSRA